MHDQPRRRQRPLLAARTLLYALGLLTMLAIVAPLALQAQEPRPAPGVNVAAERTPAPSRSLLQIIRAGGIVMIPILVSSMLVTVFVFERALALRRDRVLPGPFVKRVMHQLREGNLDRDDARELCEQNSSPIAEVLLAAFRKWGKPSVEVEQTILDEGERAAIDLRKHVRLFNAVATISPLLGLLGTVLGMITAFNDIASSAAMGRPELLAVGISEALITTAAGLVVAIPSLVLYLFFNARVDALVIEIDRIGKEVVNIISAEALAERPSRRRREAA